MQTTHLRAVAALMAAVLATAAMVTVRAQPRDPQSGGAAPAPIFPGAVPICPCESLAGVSLPNTTIESAAIDPSDGSCRVTAIVTHPPAGDRVKIFVGLPVKGWNGRFRGTAGGGLVGGTVKSLPPALAMGFATAATDTGHEGGSGSFALDAKGRLNWQAIRNNAHLGIHEMTVVGKALTKAFYGRAPRYSYFVGGSTGGRQALVEAHRYPDDYDGILCSSPAVNWPRLLAADLWPQVVMLAAGNPVPKAKFDAATAAAVAACDARDGVTDGVIDDPTRCTYDPKALVGTTVDGSVFTAADADVVRRIWEGPRKRDGTFLWHGLMPGTDLSALGETGGTPLEGKPFLIGVDWYRYFLVQDPKWDWKTLSPERFEMLFQQSVELYGDVFGPESPDLGKFRDHGGKLIIYHGLADQLIPAGGAIDFFNRVQQQAGGASKAARFVRLFLVPGVNHAFRGAGPAPNREMDPIIRWVEQGKAPDRIMAELRDANGKLIRTRPLFPYPHVAKYRGKGSTDDAENFMSSLPAS